MKKTRLQPLFVSRRWTHRGEKTGFEHFSDYIGGAELIGDAKFKKPHQLLKWLARRAQNDAYTTFSLSVELESLLGACKKRPSMVHYFYGDYELYYAPRLLRLAGVPVFASFHNPPAELKRRIEKKDFLKRLSGAVLLGANQKNFFREFCPKVPLEVIPHGIDTDFFKPGDTEKSEKPVALIVGGHLRDWPLIGRFLTGLRKAVPNLSAQFVVPEFWEKNIPKENWARNMHPVSDEQLRSLYQSSTFLFFAPLDCVASNAVVEALACGLPIVSPNVGAVSEYVTQDCGFVTRPDDLNEMVEAALELISNHDLRRRMSLACRKRGLELDWKVIRLRYFDFYKRFGLEIET